LLPHRSGRLWLGEVWIDALFSFIDSGSFRFGRNDSWPLEYGFHYVCNIWCGRYRGLLASAGRSVKVRCLPTDVLTHSHDTGQQTAARRDSGIGSSETNCLSEIIVAVWRAGARPAYRAKRIHVVAPVEQLSPARRRSSLAVGIRGESRRAARP